MPNTSISSGNSSTTWFVITARSDRWSARTGVRGDAVAGRQNYRGRCSAPRPAASSHSVDRERVGHERVGHERHEAARWTPLADREAVGGGRGNICIHLVAAGGAWWTVPVEAVIVIHALSAPG